MNAESSPTPWMPGPWNREMHGCVFLPRMLEKGRRVLEGERQGRDLMNGFCFGDYDYADSMLFRFLRTSEAKVIELQRTHANDDEVAAELIKASGRTPEQIRAWSKRFRLINAPFTAMWEADEGRRPPGLGTSLLNWFYNRLMMPPVYWFVRIATERRRRKQRTG